MKRSTKCVITAYGVAAAVLLGCGAIEASRVIDNYHSIQENRQDTFDKQWSKIFSNNKFTNFLDDKSLMRLEQLASTVHDKKLLNAAKLTNQLNAIRLNTFDLDTMIKSLNYYYLHQNDDDDLQDVNASNDALVKDAQSLVQQLNSISEQVELVNNTMSYDASITKFDKLSLVDTKLKWSNLKDFNHNVERLNSAMESQVNENSEKAKQTEIVNLQSNVDSFIASVATMKQTLDSNYISVSNLKKVTSALNSLNSDDIRSSLTDVHSSEKTETDTYYTSLNSSFIESAELQNFSTAISSMKVIVDLDSKYYTTTSKSSESYKETFKLSSITNLSNLKDSDLINIASLKNFKIEISQSIVTTAYKERTVSNDSTTSSSSSEKTSTSSSSSSR